MGKKQEVTAEDGSALIANTQILDDSIEISLELRDERNCLLHWGLGRHDGESWEAPPRSIWPPGSRVFDHAAVQTPFSEQKEPGRIVIRLNKDLLFTYIGFALYYPEEDRWDNKSGENYRIEIPKSEISETFATAMRQLNEQIDGGKLCHIRTYWIEKDYQLAVAVRKTLDGRYHIALLSDIRDPLVIHWGIASRSKYEWQLPPSSLYPAYSSTFGEKAVQTYFEDQGDYRRIDFDLAESTAPLGIPFVLYQPDSKRWLKDHGRNFFIPVALPPEHEVSPGDGNLGGMADEIIEKEMSRNSWTLMHRFNLCHDLLDQAENNIEAKTLIFVWLRYSSLRQLDWQRNYNTKPRELGHSLERLTLKLANLYCREPDDREMIRLILTTLGRGADAQRVRDEVLHIMHRRHIKEISGHFMEEWHQKLHNNTTADDIVICEAFLDFLRSDGDLNRFYQRLGEDGVTKERLESYERPIRSHPDFIPHLKNELIYDFERFLGILKEVHAATDLGTAMNNARYLCDETLNHSLDFIWRQRDNPAIPATALASKVTEARSRIKDRLTAGPAHEVRDLLYLDLALEDFLRATIESRLSSQMDSDTTGKMLGMVIENLVFSRHDPTLERSLHVWNRLSGGKNAQAEWALKTKSVLDHLGLILVSFIDHYQRLLQPKAEFLGKAFHADSWTVRLFTEEVVRGRLEFALSLLLRYFDPVLRREAHLGNWQVISRGGGIGRVKTTPDLKSLRYKNVDQPIIFVTDVVTGDEEIPKGVIAILTPDTTDIVSHVSIRARNAKLLFATCYDSKIMEKLRSFNGRLLEVGIDAGGEIFFEEASESDKQRTTAQAPSKPIHLRRHSFTTFAVSAQDFAEDNVGGKSVNLTCLQGKLPSWIRLPNSVALPFGVFEKALGEIANREVADRYNKLINDLDQAKEQTVEKTLAGLRETILQLNAPDGLVSSLRAVMDEKGLPWPEDWEQAWTCIKRVWGSKWNERAFFSRKAMNILDRDLFMAVLIQEVVEAEYAFVIHTTNPITGDKDEIYAEVVQGLGEALVANFPGRALSFTFSKKKQEPRLLSFPSKSIGLFGGGLIFRSDSNGEDLACYAGAGLYDSVMMPDPRTVSLDYADEPLFWDDRFRKDLMTSIASIGTEVEKVMESPQDIEGAYCKDRYFVLQTRPQVGLD
jgi:alpha-glucan,water dikinase